MASIEKNLVYLQYIAEWIILDVIIMYMIHCQYGFI